MSQSQTPLVFGPNAIEAKMPAAHCLGTNDDDDFRGRNLPLVFLWLQIKGCFPPPSSGFRAHHCRLPIVLTKPLWMTVRSMVGM